MLLVEPSCPTTISSSKSSIAEYSISSINFGIRWISSINRTSPGSRLDSTAAKSPLFSKAGPVVVLILVPNSLAIIWARVVLPSPGGPYNKTWSKDSFLSLAASIKTRMFSLTSVCPTYSFKDCGLMLSSNVSSCNSSPVIILSFST